MDLLLTHGFHLANDPVEQVVMKPYPPLGILYLSAWLKRAGFDVGVFDTTFEPPAAFAAFVAAARPPVVGIYTNMMTRPSVLAAIGASKQAGSRVVLGGPEAVNYPEEYLERGADVIVVGEGEHTLEALLPKLAKSGLRHLDEVEGLVFRRDDGTLCRTPERRKMRTLDDLPMPDRGAIDLKRYMDTWKEHHGASTVSLITARGCPYSCRWCSHSVFGTSYRHRSVENVADELALIRDAYAPDQVWYADDVFTLDRRWLFRLRDELARRGLSFPFETISREDRLDAEVIEALADLRCRKLWVGAESGSQRLLDAMDRKTDAVRMREVMAQLRAADIETGTFIMLGYGDEGWRDLDETVTHLKAALPDTLLTTVSYPIKGTPYYEDVAERVVLPEDWASASDREIRFPGRHSARFYFWTQRWMQHEVAWSRARAAGGAALPRASASLLKAKVARLAMVLTRNQVEA